MFPGLEYTKVSLQYDRFLRCGDVSVKEAIISKESDVYTWGEVFISVINVDQEQKGAKDYELGDTG